MGSMTPTPTLLWQVHAASLRLSVADDGTLSVRGPRSAEDLATAILKRKPEVIAHLRTSCDVCYCVLYQSASLVAGRCQTHREQGND